MDSSGIAQGHKNGVYVVPGGTNSSIYNKLTVFGLAGAVLIIHRQETENEHCPKPS